MNARRTLHAAITALVIAFASPVLGQPTALPVTPPATKAPPLAADVQGVKKLLEERFPGAPIKHVAKTSYFGLYEAMLDDRMLYTDAKVNYVFVGSIYDAKSKTNLTEQQSRKLSRVAWDQLPLGLAIKKVKGNGSRRLAVFSDADCPFCARFEETLKKVDDVTIYTFLYPIDQLHPDAARKSRMIWCSSDKVKAWDEFFVSGALPGNAGDCDNPIAATQALGQQLRVSATPTLIFVDGTVLPGAIAPPALESELVRAESEAKKLAAGK